MATPKLFPSHASIAASSYDTARLSVTSASLYRYSVDDSGWIPAVFGNEVVVGSSGSVVATDRNNIIKVDASASDVSVLLPDPGLSNKGMECVLKRTDTNALQDVTASTPSGGLVASVELLGILIDSKQRFISTGTVWEDV